jgi:type I restriction enzyme M protein
MKAPEDGGSRIAIVFNGSPLFTGAAGSGESEIRRWIIENDWLEAVVALPDQLFYNTAISTYFWIVTNRKSPQRRGKVQLVDARDFWVKMTKGLGEKHKMISEHQIADITSLYGEFTEGEKVKVFPNEAFGYQRITVERPLRLRWEVTADTLDMVKESKGWAKLGEDDQQEVEALLRGQVGTSTTDQKVIAGKLGKLPKAIERAGWDALAVADPDAPVVTNRKGEPEPDSGLRANENVPLPDAPVTWVADTTERLTTTEYRTAVTDYMATEVLPFVDDAWVDWDRTKVGYEIPLTRHFYRYLPPRPLSDIDAEIKALESEIQVLLSEVTE